MLILNADEVKSFLTMKDCMEAYKENALGRTVNHRRTHLHMTVFKPDHLLCSPPARRKSDNFRSRGGPEERHLIDLMAGRAWARRHRQDITYFIDSGSTTFSLPQCGEVFINSPRRKA